MALQCKVPTTNHPLMRIVFAKGNNCHLYPIHIAQPDWTYCFVTLCQWCELSSYSECTHTVANSVRMHMKPVFVGFVYFINDFESGFLLANFMSSEVK